MEAVQVTLLRKTVSSSPYSECASSRQQGHAGVKLSCNTILQFLTGGASSNSSSSSSVVAAAVVVFVCIQLTNTLTLQQLVMDCNHFRLPLVYQ